MINTSERNNSIDFLKGIAMIAVVLYHIGILKSGYLGVDVFFVIAGFFVVPDVYHRMESCDFSFVAYVRKKVIRLLPLVLVVSVVCLFIGFSFWLPDDYENLSESVIASIFFLQNVLSKITTGNYWDTINDYKPLMHLWYLGILMEFYIITPVIVKTNIFISNKIRKDGLKIVRGGGTSFYVLRHLLYSSFLSIVRRVNFIYFRFAFLN